MPLVTTQSHHPFCVREIFIRVAPIHSELRCGVGVTAIMSWHPEVGPLLSHTTKFPEWGLCLGWMVPRRELEPPQGYPFLQLKLRIAQPIGVHPECRTASMLGFPSLEKNRDEWYEIYL